MLPFEELSSLRNTVIPGGNQRQETCRFSCNLNKHTISKQYPRRNANYHIPPALIHEYRAPFQSGPGTNNQMRPFGYYLQSDQYINKDNDDLHPFLPFPASLNPSFATPESSASNPNYNGVYSTQKTDYENYIQPYHFTSQHIFTPPPPYSSPIFSSLSSSITTSAVPPTTIKRKCTRRVHRPPVKQQLLQYPNISNATAFPNNWSSLPLPSMTDTLLKPNECTFSGDLMRALNSAPISLPDFTIPSNSPSHIINSKSNSITVPQQSIPHSPMNMPEHYPTSKQCLSDQRCSDGQKTINYCSTSNLSYNLPYFLPIPDERYYMLPPYPMSLNIPAMTCATLLPTLDTTYSSVPFSDNMKKVRKKRASSQNSKAVQNPTVEVLTDEKTMAPMPLITKIPDLKRRLQRKSRIENYWTKTLIKRMKQKNKLIVTKFLIRKRKQQQISKKKLPEAKIEEVIPPMIESDVSKTVESEAKLDNIITSNLKITFNAAQKIESISLCYRRRQILEVQSQHSPITSTTTENKLNLLIKAVSFIEMYNGNSKHAIESLE